MLQWLESIEPSYIQEGNIAVAKLYKKSTQHKYINSFNLIPSISELINLPISIQRATYILSSAKIVCGCGLLAAGATALYLKASYGHTSSGLWAGTIVIISGVLGIFSVIRHASRPYVLTFFASSVLSLIASVLVIIYAATGLARDSGYSGNIQSPHHVLWHEICIIL